MYSSLLQSVQDAEQNYSEEKDRDLSTNLNEEKKLTRENVFGAGQSKRIWNELYKVIDSSDVIIQVPVLSISISGQFPIFFWFCWKLFDCQVIELFTYVPT
jgi:hypothetical protein